MDIATILVIAAALALIPAEIARRKGQGFVAYYIFGFMLWIVAMPMVLMAENRRKKKEIIRDF